MLAIIVKRVKIFVNMPRSSDASQAQGRAFFIQITMALTAFNKTHLDFSQQVQLLKSRGMVVNSDSAAEECLSRIGYYRLAAYWYPFREVVAGTFPPVKAQSFSAGSKFEWGHQLYVYDKKLKLLILDAIERIEIAVRVNLAHHMGQIHPFAQHTPTVLDGRFTRLWAPHPVTGVRSSQHLEWLKKYQSALDRTSEAWLDEFNRTYAPPLPIWMAVEVWDFGLLSYFYSGIKVPDKSAVATNYGIPDWKVMESWLRVLNVVRNIVAHHGRLWNRNMDVRPVLPRLGTMSAFDPLHGDIHAISRIYGVLCIIIHLMEQVHPRSEWKRRLRTHIDNFPFNTGLSLREMGFPNGWENHDFWK